MKIEWVDGFEIKAAIESGEIVISANREGMLSLAKQLTALADGVPGDHIHYDEYNSLEEGSTEMIIVMCHGDGSSDTLDPMCQKNRPHDTMERRVTYGYDLSCRRLLLGAPEVL